MEQGSSVIPPLSEEQREQLAAVARKILEVWIIDCKPSIRLQM
jgi:hypothetical protein